jgi:catechol 2,3-dioxygenase-like lactoylglutathione lyase family enzyme
MFHILATHVSVDVADLEATMRYLDDVLGLSELREVNRPNVRVVWYPGLELAQAKPESPPGVVKHVAWEVDDILAAMQDLRAQGVTFEGDEPRQIETAVVSTHQRVRYVFFTTPVGLRGELVQVDLPPAS